MVVASAAAAAAAAAASVEAWWVRQRRRAQGPVPCQRAGPAAAAVCLGGSRSPPMGGKKK